MIRVGDKWGAAWNGPPVSHLEPSPSRADSLAYLNQPKSSNPRAPAQKGTPN